MCFKKKEKEKNNKPDKKKGRKLILMILVFGLAIASLFISIYGAGEGDFIKGFNTVKDALISSDPLYLALTAGVFFFSFFIEGLIFLVFCRLYTRRYYLHQGVANAFIGAFYNNVTPSQSGGQVMQAYTFKKQGIEISNAASILVMSFILYQASLIIFDIFAISFEWETIMSITSFKIPNFSLFGWNGELPMLPLIILGFILNVSLILLLLLMSYSHRFHNFIMHYIVGFLGKIRLVKDPDKTRENLRVQVENFKVELKRLQTNVPVTILILVLYLAVLFFRFSAPYFAGMALHAYGAQEGFSFLRLTDACFRSAFHQMVTGLIPIPGGAGVSELFYVAMFNDFFTETYAVGANGLEIIRSASGNIMTSQILWRFITFYLLLLVSGLVAALYRSRAKESFRYATRQTFVDLQMATYETRKISVDTLYETKQLSSKNIRKRLIQSSPKWGLMTGDDMVASPFEASYSPPASKKKDKGGNLLG